MLIFTEFADTARYLRTQLTRSRASTASSQIDSGTKANRAEVIRRFSPYYNGSSSAELAATGQDEIRVLVATDVLSEGLNLQDATRLINYDIHWNPVRLMQRIGRVDRRLNPDVEAAHRRRPSRARQGAGHRSRTGTSCRPTSSTTCSTLYGKVSHKTLLISKTLGIEGKKLLTPEDDFEALKEFNAAYEGETTCQEELHLEYQQLLDEHPDLEERSTASPARSSAAERAPTARHRRLLLLSPPGARHRSSTSSPSKPAPPAGTSYALDDGDDPRGPARDRRVHPIDAGDHRASPRSTALTSSTRATRCVKHIKNTYLKRVDAPIDAPKPSSCAGWSSTKADA